MFAAHHNCQGTEENYNFLTGSDCEVILALYKEKGSDFVDDLNGIFGFAVYDTATDEYLIARDHMGIVPLYIGWDQNGTFYVASELKALEGTCTKIELFPPGHYLSSKDGEFIKWYHSDWYDDEAVKDIVSAVNFVGDYAESFDKLCNETKQNGKHAKGMYNSKLILGKSPWLGTVMVNKMYNYRQFSTNANVLAEQSTINFINLKKYSNSIVSGCRDESLKIINKLSKALKGKLNV